MARQQANWDRTAAWGEGAGARATGTILELFWETAYRLPYKKAIVQMASPGVPPRAWSYRKLAV